MEAMMVELIVACGMLDTRRELATMGARRPD